MNTGNSFRQIVLAALAVAITALVCYPFAELIGYRSVALILLLVVSVLAMRQGLAAVITAALLSALLWDFFFVPPRFTLSIASSEDALLLLMYFIVASLNGIINYRIRQMAQLKKETVEREQALKLYNTLFSSLSHDLRTPIAAILGAADMLSGDQLSKLSDEQRNGLVSEISNGALRLSGQVENLLNVSRIEAGALHVRREWCDVEDLIRGFLQKLPPDVEHRTIEVVMPDEFPLVQLDFGLTTQIIENLIFNAKRHTPPGTKITIKATILHELQGHFEEVDTSDLVKVISEPTNSLLVLDISDNGPGISPDELPYIFDKFYHNSEKADGSGLGLFVVRGFTEAQGGEVRVRNLQQGGVCFTLEFPTPVLNQTIHNNAG